MPRVLITGGSGFIGTAVIHELIRQRKQNGLDIQIRAFDLNKPAYEGVEAVQGSVLDISDVGRAAEGCDYVIHLAALLGVQKSEARRLDCLNINILGTQNVLNACIQDRVKKIIFASSSEVYGDQTRLPISETNPVNPKSVYAVSKLAGEEYIRAYALRYGIQYTILRFFNVYGPGQVGEFVTAKFIKAVQDEQSPVIYGKGDQNRSFCYGGDVAQGVIKALFSDKATGETINLGNDRESITIAELAHKIVKLSGKPHLKPKFVSMSESDRTIAREIKDRAPDISKARRLLEYEPQCTLDEGITRILEHGKVAATWSR